MTEENADRDARIRGVRRFLGIEDGIADSENPTPAPITPHPTAARGQRHQEVTVNIPGATSADLRDWAGRIEVENPITYDMNERWPNAGINVTDHPFMGVELTLAVAGRPLLTLTLFGDRPNDEERNIMETHNGGTAGL